MELIEIINKHAEKMYPDKNLRLAYKEGIITGMKLSGIGDKEND